MSPNTKKKLKTHVTCSDGFEGKESQPIGRTMPIRLHRRYPQAFRQSMARVSELTFTSRGYSEYIENPPETAGRTIST